MRKRETVVFFTGIFLFVWFLCAWMVYEGNTRLSPVCRTAWTLRVVKVVDHIVKQGESLTKIAKKYGVSLQEILKANSIKDPDSVKAGEKIKVPLKKIKGEVLI